MLRSKLATCKAVPKLNINIKPLTWFWVKNPYADFVSYHTSDAATEFRSNFLFASRRLTAWLPRHHITRGISLRFSVAIISLQQISIFFFSSCFPPFCKLRRVGRQWLCGRSDSVLNHSANSIGLTNCNFPHFLYSLVLLTNDLLILN